MSVRRRGRNMTRREISIAFTAVLLFGGAFVLLPALAIRLNDALSLPRWRVLPLQALGVPSMLGAVLLYAYGARVFSRQGGGTTSPIRPPERLVATGLFRYSRNPIYVGYVAFLLGLFLLFGHLALLVYTALVAAFIHMLLVFWEEPDLRRRFGPDYEKYTQEVPRWLGLRRRRCDEKHAV